MKEEKIVNDEGMYDYFHSLLEGKLDFLNSRKAENSEENSWQKSLTFYNFEQLYETRRAFYSDREVCNELCVADDILCIFQKYYCIPGIERLLINNYGSLENDIFLEYDARTGMPKRIREHYKHQYRNTYLGSLLMLEYGLLDAMTECISASDYFVARYIKTQVGRDKEEIKRILYKSYFISAMFHDIGYPLDYFLRKAKQIHQYAPFYKIISSHIKTTFTEIKAALAESLLFQLVKEDQIEAKYDRNDHGCLSAISFLLNFYSAGSIFSLNNSERCMVEISALAIFRHTDWLENDYMIFEQDPLSYMVRLCDDLQEWERFLLVINEKHNYLKCSNCGSIIKPNGREYSCKCGLKYEKITDIVNKKVNYVSLCNDLKLVFDRDKNELEIYLDFDYYKQIEVIPDDYHAVQKRAEDLEKVCGYLCYQKYLPNISLQTNLSNNPIWLISHFLKERNMTIQMLKEKNSNMEGDDVQEYTKNMDEFLDILDGYLSDEELAEKEFGKQLESDELRYGGKSVQFVEEYLGQIHSIMKDDSFSKTDA
ncbi:MAG: hypothetical protein NC123_07610 [Butyrivibrio sp.]|nr:hypothetical protein [Acetatifactor muris]MCM1559397.1 hypothetical protein [Butyrivibrio sp.]